MDHSRCSSQWLGAMVVAVVCLAGCLCPAPTPEATALPDTPTPSPTLEASTKAPSFTPIPPSIPTLELPAGTPAPSPIPPTRTPRPTPAPTMAADEEYAFVSEMLQSNGGCRLPCWWGFTPGETRWETTKTFFASLGKEMHAWSVGGIQHYTVYFDIPHHHFHYQSYHEKGDVLDRISIHAVPPADEDGYRVYGHPQFAEDWKAYMLPQILEVYGPPSQVLLGTGGAPWLPFDLILFYSEKGFLVEYRGVAEEREGETWLVCPHLVDIMLYLWSPERSMNLEDIPGVIDAHADDPTWGPYSLEEATGMSIEQFYQTFVQPDTETCLEVPADLW